MKTLQEIEARVAEIKQEVENRKSELKSEDISKFMSEVETLETEKRALIEENEKRQALLDKIANSENVNVISKRNFMPTAKTETDGELLGSFEYRKAFKDFVTKGNKIPAEYRADAFTSTTDAAVLIPTTIIKKVYEKLETLGAVYNAVTKTSYKGDATLPISSLKPSASWGIEGSGADRQKEIFASINFTGYKLSCPVAMSFETDVMTLDLFENTVVKHITEAMLKAIEIAIISGSGTGQPKGILAETVVTGQTVAVPATGFDYETLIKAEGVLPEGYDPTAKWFMSKKTFVSILGLTDDNGQPILRNGVNVNGKFERTIFGREVIVTNNIKSLGGGTTATGDVIAFLFSPENYIFNINSNTKIKRYEDNDLDLVVLKGIMLVDGKVVDKNSLVTLTATVTAG
ncbi:hypothetical protein FACS1894132_09740 [Clostridia bacterium]|nr:hypothetical protein FACS1894132_09740 [Clostridia bacterium]